MEIAKPDTFPGMSARGRASAEPSSQEVLKSFPSKCLCLENVPAPKGKCLESCVSTAQVGRAPGDVVNPCGQAELCRALAPWSSPGTLSLLPDIPSHELVFFISSKCLISRLVSLLWKALQGFGFVAMRN